MTQFRAAVEAEFEKSRAHPQYAVWRDYALGTNARGEDLVEKMKTWSPSLRGLRTLDVGAGYGGTCIAMAKSGAHAVGIEVDETLLALARANEADHPGLQVTLLRADAMDWANLAQLGTFDLVTCDNVIEHVPNPHVLVAHLRRLMKPDTVLYLTAPNAFSAGQIRSECHYGQAGLSLLDPLDGVAYVKEALGQASYDVTDYLTFDGYLALFERFGLHTKVLNPVRAADVEVGDVRQAHTLVTEFPLGGVPAVIRPKVERELGRWLASCEADLRWFEALPAGDVAREAFGHRLHREYVSELWYFALSPTLARVEPAARPVTAMPVEPPIRDEARRLAGRVFAEAARRFRERSS